MSESDVIFVKHIQNMVKNAKDEKGKKLERLTYSKIAEIKGIDEQSFKNKLRGQSSFIDFWCLEKMYQAIQKKTCTDADKFKVYLPVLKANIDKQADIDIQKIISARDTCQFIRTRTSNFAFVTITSLVDLEIIIKTLLHSNLGTKDVNLSLNQDLLVDAVNLIEDYAYGDNGNFSDWLTVRLFIPSYTVFADIVAGGVSDNGIIALIQDEDKVFVPMSDAGKSLVNLEIQLLQQQTPVWSLTKSPELRVIKKLQRDGADIPDDVFEIVTSRYENAQPYVKGDVFTRLFEINPYLGAEYVKMVNDHYS